MYLIVLYEMLQKSTRYSIISEVFTCFHASDITKQFNDVWYGKELLGIQVVGIYIFDAKPLYCVKNGLLPGY